MAKEKLEPREGIRAIDYLCRLFPDKTGTELLAIHEHDKKCYELYMQKGQEKVRAFAKRINDAGALYYKGRFGMDQRYFYKVYNATVESNGAIYANVDSLVCFLGEKGDVSEGRISIKLEVEKYKDLSTYGLSVREETTEEDYNEALSHLREVSKFWEKFKEDKY